jgi:hypothetical protein
MKKTTTTKLLLSKATLSNLNQSMQMQLKGGEEVLTITQMPTRRLSCKETCILLSCDGTCANSCPLTCMSCYEVCDL